MFFKCYVVFLDQLAYVIIYLVFEYLIIYSYIVCNKNKENPSHMIQYLT